MEKTQISGSKSEKKFLLPVLVLIFLFGGFLLATRIWDPLWNPFRPNPEEVIKKAVLEAKKIKTCEEKIELLLSGKNEGKIEFKLNVDSKNDVSQPENVKTEGKFNLFLSQNGKETLPSFEIALAGETKKIGETLYLKITQLPSFPFLEMTGLDLSQIKDRWIKIDRESVLNLLKEMAGEEWTPEVEEMLKENIEKQRVLEKKLQEKIINIFSGKQFYLVKKELPDEKISGIKVYHYLFALDKKEISKAIFEILEVIEETVLKEYGATPLIEKEKFKKELEEFFDKLGEIEGEIWIGKKDYLPYKVKLEKKIDLSKFVNEKGEFLIKLDIENSKFNLPLKIEAPSESKDLDEILTPFLSKLKEEREKEKIKVEMSYLKNVAEFIYVNENSYQSLCQNLLLNKNHPIYGFELRMIEDAIMKAQGGILNLSCYSSKESYCITVDLISKKKYCIDSTHFSGEIGENSKCLGKGTKTDPYRCPK